MRISQLIFFDYSWRACRRLCVGRQCSAPPGRPGLRRARPEQSLRAEATIIKAQPQPSSADGKATAGCASGTTIAWTPWNCGPRTGNVTNLFSNEEDESNGLVKAWAQIDADGTIIACWRCNTDPAETRRTSTAGHYEVDFTPLATDITGRPRSVALDGDGIRRWHHRAGRPHGDPSSVFVDTRLDTAGAISRCYLSS